MYILARMFNDRLRPVLLAATIVTAVSGCTAAPEPPPTPTEIRRFSSNGVKAVIEVLQSEIERGLHHADQTRAERRRTQAARKVNSTRIALNGNAT